MASFQYPQWQQDLQTTISNKLNNLKSYVNILKNLATSLANDVKKWKSNRNKAMINRSKTRNLRHLKHFHLVLIANEQIIPPRSAGAVLRQLTDLNGLNETNQQ